MVNYENRERAFEIGYDLGKIVIFQDYMNWPPIVKSTLISLNNQLAELEYGEQLTRENIKHNLPHIVNYLKELFDDSQIGGFYQLGYNCSNIFLFASQTDAKVNWQTKYLSGLARGLGIHKLFAETILDPIMELHSGVDKNEAQVSINEYCLPVDAILQSFNLKSLETFDDYSNNKIIVGDQYNINNSQGAFGRNAEARENLFHQINQDIDYGIVEKELEILKNALKDLAETGEEYVELSEIVQAQQAAANKNRTALLKHLSKVGKWTFDTAQKVGINVVSKLLQQLWT